MDCQQAKRSLIAQRDHADTPTEFQDEAVREHLRGCPTCRAYEQRLRHMQVVQPSSVQRVYSSISTERIMQAVAQEKFAAKQVEAMRVQQQRRMVQQRSIVLPTLLIVAFTLLVIPLLLATVAMIEPDMVANMPPALSGLIYMIMLGVQYLHTGSALITKDTALLVIGALALVIMVGMWLRLMRSPRQA
jgi:predicted anti-sigma-YlaC factor YlaD